MFTGSDGHIHELHLDGGGPWKKADLSAMTGAPNAGGDPFAYDPSMPRVIYRGDDSHVHELRLEDGMWKKGDLTALAGAPGAEGRLSAYWNQEGSQRVPRVLFRDDAGHIQELRLEDGGWKKADLTALANAAPAAGDPVGYATPIPRVVYRGQDADIHELRLE